MINVEIHNDDRQKAVEVLKYKNFGNRSSGFNGNYEKQYTGLIGDLTVHRLLEMDPPNYNEGRIDTDILVNDKKIDVKSMLRKHDMRDDGTSFKTYAPLYEIKQEKLNKLNDIKDLKNI